MLPRGVETVLAMIAVLKAGATYVPLDPETPTERTQLCLAEAKPALILTEAGLCDLRDEARSASVEPLAVELKPDDLAYIIFTSGTTGQPKGVPITHRSLNNFVQGNQEICIRVAPEDRVFQGFSPASDGHHEEIWPTFLAGATLVVATTDIVHSGPELGDFLTRHGVTIISCAPTLLAMVDQELPVLRRILFGAERCPEELVRRWWTPTREIINTYGPTEATVGATFALCQPGEPVTIGMPLPGYDCYVLDAQQQPVAPGEEGELCLAGIGLSPGYLGDESLSAGKFLPNPFAKDAGGQERLYRTGDRARRRPDGQLEWLGRIDSQVKIRGYRIELSDIESYLLKDPGVRSTVVMVRHSKSPQPRLTALMVLREGNAFDSLAFFSRLRQELPSYMVPQVFETVSSLPVLPSGKLDRRAAAQLRGEPLRSVEEKALPRTEAEWLVKNVWEELFDGTIVGHGDNFFDDLGGYSLLATQCLARLRSQYGLPSISVRDLYENPTLESFAACLALKRLSSSEPPAPEAPFLEVPPARYRWATLLQALSLLFFFGFRGVFWLAPFAVALHAMAQGSSFITALLLSAVVHAVSIPLSFLIVIALKWLIAGRFQAGEYPLWGKEFLRWWFVQRLLNIAPKPYITGTPLAVLYLRLLGARVGSNVILDSLEIDCPDLVEIGNDAILSPRCWLHAAHVAGGQLTLRPLQLGKGVLICTNAGVRGGATLGEGACLTELSSVGEGVTIANHEEWAGSPARRQENAEHPPYVATEQPTRNQRCLFGATQTALALALPLIDTLPLSLALLSFYPLFLQGKGLAAAPVLIVANLLAICAQILLAKWGLLGRVQPGTYSTMGSFALRKWLVDKLIELHQLSLAPIYDTLYTRSWCQALGTRCGARTELAMPLLQPYDLAEFGEENFLASDHLVATQRRRNDKLVLERTITQRRVFIGNDSVVPAGNSVPEGTLLGALSVYPHQRGMGSQPGQTWMGVPSLRLPQREHFEGFKVELTYKPTHLLVMERLLRESLIRILLPSLASLSITMSVLLAFQALWQATSLWEALASAPLLYLGSVLLAFGVLLGTKKILIGTYKPQTQPLWSRYVWNHEALFIFFHVFAVGMFVELILGTPFYAMFLRCMGAKVGRRAFIETSHLTEFDLISIAEDAAINYNVALQAHLFEDRVMKVGTISIGKRCSVDCGAIILYNTQLQDGSQVGPLSLVMKGETIPTKASWAGSPAQPVTTKSALPPPAFTTQKMLW